MCLAAMLLPIHRRLPSLVANTVAFARRSAVTDMSFMFEYAKAFDRDIGGWEVSSVKDMRSMFSGAASFHQDIGRWDVREVKDMGSMFSGAKSFDMGCLNDWSKKP